MRLMQAKAYFLDEDSERKESLGIDVSYISAVMSFLPESLTSFREVYMNINGRDIKVLQATIGGVNFILQASFAEIENALREKLEEAMPEYWVIDETLENGETLSLFCYIVSVDAVICNPESGEAMVLSNGDIIYTGKPYRDICDEVAAENSDYNPLFEIDPN